MPARRERGAALLVTFLMMLILSGLATAIVTFSQNSQLTGRSTAQDQQAFYLAEAGAQRARQALAAGTWVAVASPGNTYTESFGPGVYSVTVVDSGGGEYAITSSGYVPNATTYVARRQVAEVEIPVTAADGTNQSLTATASASSASGSHPAADAKDGSTGTFWQAGSNGDGWLAMDLGSAKTLTKIVVLENSNIAAVTMQYSDNGSSWTTITGQSIIESPSKTWTSTFTAASHRYFRASITSTGSNKKPSVDEMECYNSSISALGQGEVTTTW